MKSEYVIGESARGTMIRMTEVEQRKVLKGFRSREFNILIATNVIEEGLDVPAVDLIIRFN